MSNFFGPILLIGMWIFAAIYIVSLVAVGYSQIDISFGWGWAWLAAIAFFAFRFTLPITIAAFFGAQNIWGWHWFVALIFAAPTLLIMIPAVFATLFSLLIQSPNKKHPVTIEIDSREIEK